MYTERSSRHLQCSLPDDRSWWHTRRSTYLCQGRLLRLKPRLQLCKDAGFRSVTKPTSETSAKELWERFFCLSPSTGSASACPRRSLRGRWHSDRTTGRAAGIVHPPRLSHRATGPMPTARRRSPCCAIFGHRPPMPGSHSARRGSLTTHLELDSALSRFHG